MSGHLIRHKIAERPMEMATCLVAVSIAIPRLIERGTSGGFFFTLFYVALILGGALTAIGHIRGKRDVESAGYSLLIGGFLYAMTYRLNNADNTSERVGAVLSYATLTAGLALRLWVVRRADSLARRVRGG